MLIGLLIGLVVGGALGLVAGVLAAGANRTEAAQRAREELERANVADIAQARRARAARQSAERVVAPPALTVADAPEPAESTGGRSRRSRLGDRSEPR